MVVQKTIDNLKERPKDEKTAVATGAAVLVVAVLLFAWGLWFVSNLKRGGNFDTYIEGPGSEMLPKHLREANERLKQLSRTNQEQLQGLRDGAVDVTQEVPQTESESDPF